MVNWIVLGAAGFAAGVVNAVAGGGSLISFPALLHAGMGARIANATNTVAVWPGAASSVYAYRAVLGQERRRAWVLAWPSLLGGLAGSWLLLHTPERAFRVVVPWLILFACLLLAVQGPVARWMAQRAGPTSRHVPPGLMVAQLLIAVYGGYFGAGIGILMLAAMAIFIPESMQVANGLKVLLACLINGISAVYFLLAPHASHLVGAGMPGMVGAVRIPEALVMMATSVVGGLVGAAVAQRLAPGVMRLVVIAFGLAVAAQLLLA
jgi:uncharacterized membrane protein YfcA